MSASGSILLAVGIGVGIAAVLLAMLSGKADRLAHIRRDSAEYQRGYQDGWQRRERYGDGGRRPWTPPKGTPHRRDWINPGRRSGGGWQ